MWRGPAICGARTYATTIVRAIISLWKKTLMRQITEAIGKNLKVFGGQPRSRRSTITFRISSNVCRLR